MSEAVNQYKVDDRVKLLVDVWDDGADHHPPGYFARKGEVLIVRSVEPKTFPVYVSHEDVTDNVSGVRLDEIAPVAPARPSAVPE